MEQQYYVQTQARHHLWVMPPADEEIELCGAFLDGLEPEAFQRGYRRLYELVRGYFAAVH